MGRLYAPVPGLPPVQAHLERMPRVQRCPTIASAPLRGRTRHRANTEGIGAAPSAGVNRRELPSLYLSANENENRPSTSGIFFRWYQNAWHAPNDERHRNRTHGTKRSSCCGVPLSDVWAMRRSRSSRRWMRCLIAMAECPLRRASSGPEIPSSLN